jgi:hypothetical protein
LVVNVIDRDGTVRIAGRRAFGWLCQVEGQQSLGHACDSSLGKHQRMAASREMRAESSVKLTVRHRLDVSMSLFGGSCTIQLLNIVELNVHFTDLKRHLKFQYQ